MRKISFLRNFEEILQYDLNGNLIKEWNTINDAQRYYKSNGRISLCLSGKIRKAHESIWKYKDGLPPNQAKGGPKPGSKYKRKSEFNINGVKSVLQFSLDGVFLEKFKSISEARSILNLGGEIGPCCRKLKQIAYGFRWKFEDDTSELEPLLSKKSIFPIIQFSIEGEYIKEYMSISEIKNNFNGNISGIYSCCDNKQKTCMGFIWKSKIEDDNETS